MAHWHPIFREINDGALLAVQQRVLADAAVLEEWVGENRMTPLVFAVNRKKPAIALWLIQHRAQHNLETACNEGVTALHGALGTGLVEVVQALVAAGANPAALTDLDSTPLILASLNGRSDVVAFFLQLPVVNATIDHITVEPATVISCASLNGYKPIVQLLLDAGANPTIPAGQYSPLNQAVTEGHYTIAALLRHVIAEADRARALHKARSLLGAGAAAISCLQGRMEREEGLPQVELTPQQHPQQEEKLRATAAFAVGVSGGEKDSGLCEELYVELLGYMLPAWVK